MAKFTSNRAAVERFFREKAIGALDRAGVQGKAEGQGNTRRATGFAADSVHYVVLDEQGARVAGDTTDGNQNPVPDYAGNGTLRVIVGSNTAPREDGDGRGYYVYLERGVQGRPGDATLAQALDMMEAVAGQELRR